MSGLSEKVKSSVELIRSMEEHIERALHRIYTLRDLGYNPFVMIYDKPHADKRLRRLQSWCNNKHVFHSCERYEDYDTKRR